MDGITLIRSIRQIRIVIYNWKAGQSSPRQPTLRLLPQKNYTWLDAFVVLIVSGVGLGSAFLGGLHIHECNAEEDLALCVKLFGILLVYGQWWAIPFKFRYGKEMSQCASAILLFHNVTALLAEFALFLPICYWIFTVRPTTNPDNHESEDYCDYFFYKTTFCGCIGWIIFFVLTVIYGCYTEGISILPREGIVQSVQEIPSLVTDKQKMENDPMGHRTVLKNFTSGQPRKFISTINVPQPNYV